MKRFFKIHLGLIIFLIIILVFPVSLSNQVKLNMRVIVTGLAIDKVDDQYEVTAQIVKLSPETKSSGQSSQIDFISDKSETISKALANLMYKTGKVAAFSHTNFVIIGNDVLDEDVTKCLDIFVRDKLIKNSAMILVAKEKAGDELKKTKNLELSVGLGLQKVYTFKQEESDGLMVTILDFLNDNKMYGKTAVTSMIELESGDEQSGSSSGQSSSGSSSGNSGEQSSSESSSSGSEEQNSSSGGPSSDSEKSGSSSGSGKQSGKVNFKSNAELKCFIDGKYVCDLKDDEILGFMISTKKTKSSYIEIDEIDNEDLKDAKMTVVVRSKSISKKVRFEEEIPCIDLSVTIFNGEINEVLSKQIISDFTEEQYKAVEEALKKKISDSISKLFEKSKQFDADFLNAYELAYKFNYNKLKKYYNFDEKEFMKNLKLNVDVSIKKLEY